MLRKDAVIGWNAEAEVYSETSAIAETFMLKAEDTVLIWLFLQKVSIVDVGILVASDAACKTNMRKV